MPIQQKNKITKEQCLAQGLTTIFIQIKALFDRASERLVAHTNDYLHLTEEFQVFC